MFAMFPFRFFFILRLCEKWVAPSEILGWSSEAHKAEFSAVAICTSFYLLEANEWNAVWSCFSLLLKYL